MFLDCLILSLFSMFIVSGLILAYSRLKDSKRLKQLKEKQLSEEREFEDNGRTVE